MIEKTPVTGFLHYRTDLGDGVRTGVVFSFCREKCSDYCRNFHFLPEHFFGADTQEKSRYSEEEMIAYLREEKTLCYTKKLGITFLGAEPLQDPFFCKSVAKGLKEDKMDLQIYTCGMCSLSAYDVMDDLVDLYVLRLFTLAPFEDYSFPDPKFALSALDHFERRGYSYRVQIPVISGVNTHFSHDFAQFLGDKKHLKSVILDFTNSGLKAEEISAYKEAFLTKGTILYSI